MIKHGIAPFLECSSKGDIRFSAFYAQIRNRGNKSIEQIYQASKILADGSTNHTWREAKGQKAINQKDCNKLYSQLWDEYIQENPELLDILKEQSGLSDMFGQVGHCCQATELWRIRNKEMNSGTQST